MLHVDGPQKSQSLLFTTLTRDPHNKTDLLNTMHSPIFWGIDTQKGNLTITTPIHPIDTNPELSACSETKPSLKTARKTRWWEQ